MQLEAIYDQGRLEFIRPLRLKPERLRVIVEIPDDAVVGLVAPLDLPPEVPALAARMRTRLDEIRDAPLPADEQLPPVNAETLERIEAFALRENR